MIVRIDDVNANTDFRDFYQQLDILQPIFDEIILGVNLFSKSSSNGAIYPELPLRNHPQEYFYDVDRILYIETIESLLKIPKVSIVSHGLIHGMHSQMSKDAIQMSILTSCSMLKTKRFIPPFNEINETVKQVCESNGIEIIGNDERRLWHSLESEAFDPKYKFWYYHPWRINSEELFNSMMAVK